MFIYHHWVINQMQSRFNLAAHSAHPLFVVIILPPQGSVCTTVSSSPGSIFRLEPGPSVSLPTGGDRRDSHGTHG